MSAERAWESRFRGFRALQVVRSRSLSPRMRRVTLGGPEIEGLPDGANIKLLVPPPGAAAPVFPVAGPDGRPVWPADSPRPAMRTFSLRRYDRAAGTIDVDFVLHPGGAAAEWAGRAQPGDVIGAGQPGGLTIEPADWYLLAGDLSALPAISRILEDLPASARGVALIEVPGSSEEQALACTAAVDVRWIHRDAARADGLALEDEVRRVAIPAGVDLFGWVAGESSSVRAIRVHLRGERGIDRRRLLVVGYWKRGMNYQQYHDAHDHDRDEDYHARARELRAAAAGGR